MNDIKKYSRASFYETSSLPNVNFYFYIFLGVCKRGVVLFTNRLAIIYGLFSIELAKILCDIYFFRATIAIVEIERK